MSSGVKDVLERIGSNQELWFQRIKKMLKTNQLRGCFFATKQDSVKIAARKRRLRTANLTPQGL
jgi:uncharacterized Zn finger protein